LSYLSEMSELVNFTAYENQLSGTLAGLSGLTNLSYLNVRNNQSNGELRSVR